jgi:hypothetical protein
MISAREAVDQAIMRGCTRRALAALAALRQADCALRELPEPSESTGQTIHQAIYRELKKANIEIFEILFSTSLAVDTRVPEVPRFQ